MRKSRFTEQQIAFALRQAESGTKVSEMKEVQHLPTRKSI
jgi:hypothetical protein